MSALTNPAVTNRWNRAFTNILRQKDQTVWGNWTLSSSVVAGAVGIIDPDTGNFTLLRHLPRAEVLTIEGAERWFVESSGVRRTESQIDFRRGYADPSSGLDVTVGTAIGWSFSQEGSLSSNGHVIGRSNVNAYADLIARQFEWLYDLANAVGFATSDGIRQGFGIVTQTWDCCGAINLGSHESDSFFTLTGSVDGIAAMTGVGTVRDGIKGSYKTTQATKAFERRSFPPEANLAAQDSIAISYNFASFDKRVLMPHWAGPRQTST